MSLSLINRRRLIMSSNIISDEYVQDGLVFYLDGTDKQQSGNVVWTDKIGGITFTNGGLAEELPNGFRFNGSGGSILIGNRVLNTPDKNNYTIEIVCCSRISYDTWKPLFVLNNWNTFNYLGAAVMYNGESNYIHSFKFIARNETPDLNCYAMPHNELVTLSSQYNTPIYVNKNLVTQVAATNTSAFSSLGNAYVGGRIHGTTSTIFIGDIHAIRVYDRRLTQNEILNNQRIDMLKYNIS